MAIPSKEEKMAFSVDIENLVNTGDMNYIEAVVYLCEQRDLEISVAASLIDKNLKAKLQITAEQLRLLPKSSRLPL